MIDLHEVLNPEQYEAATAGGGPLLVLAAAGTGKTQTLVYRVAYLLDQGVPPNAILLLTFTNRAASEMLERARAVAGDQAGWVWGGTFHSICNRFLRRHARRLGFQPDFTIADRDDTRKLIERAMDERNSINQQTMIELQSATSKRDQAYDMISNILKSLGNVLTGTVNNM